MSRTDTAALVAALLCVVAIGLAAATVASPIDNDEFSQNFGETPSGDVTPIDLDIDQSVGWGGGPGGGHWEFSTTCVPFLLTPLFYVLAVGGFVGVFLAVRRLLASEYAFAVVAFLVPVSLFGHATLTEHCIPEPTTANFGLPQGSMINDTVAAATQPVDPSASTPILGLAVAAAFLLLVVAALVTTVRHRSSSMQAAQEAPTATSSHDLAGVARVAGEAADRIEGGEADPRNAVYRAWQDMTDHLDLPDRRTTTPAEFRDAALDAGLSATDVSTITDLFREVRYGGEAPTADREERAVAALRAIEDAYGGDDE